MRLTGAVTVFALVISLATTGFAPASAREVKPHYFGLVVPDPVLADAPVRYGALNTMTSGVYWKNLERSPGNFEWGRLDAIIDHAEARGMTPMVVLGLTPEFYSRPELGTVYWTQVPPMDAWRRYVRAAIERYGTRADYQVWPEGNVANNWTGTPAELAKLVRVAARIKDRIAPAATLLSPAVVLRWPYQRRWFQKFLRTRFNGRSVGAYVDVIALDPYVFAEGTPEDTMELVDWARRTARRFGVFKPMWTVEINYGVGPAGEPRVPLPPGQAAAFLVRTYLISAEHSLRRVYWLFWGDTRMGIDTLDADGTLTPAGHAFGVVRRWMAGWNHEGCELSARGNFVCHLTSERAVRRVHWRITGRSRVRVPETARFRETQLGARKELVGGQRILVTERPVMVHSRR